MMLRIGMVEYTQGTCLNDKISVTLKQYKLLGATSFSSSSVNCWVCTNPPKFLLCTHTAIRN